MVQAYICTLQKKALTNPKTETHTHTHRPAHLSCVQAVHADQAQYRRCLCVCCKRRQTLSSCHRPPLMKPQEVDSHEGRYQHSDGTAGQQHDTASQTSKSLPPCPVMFVTKYMTTFTGVLSQWSLGKCSYTHRICLFWFLRFSASYPAKPSHLNDSCTKSKHVLLTCACAQFWYILQMSFHTSGLLNNIM